jgi:hypothetical protein
MSSQKRKSVSPDTQSREKNENCNIKSVIPVLNIANLSPQARSPRRSEITKLTDFYRSQLAAGITVREDCSHVGRYRADPIKAMRQLASHYPGEVRLVLNCGIWMLIPLAGVQI